MSIRHLDFLFRPRSVAVFGASERAGSVGATVWRNLRQGGFEGELFAVNPKHSRFGDVRVYSSAAALPQVPELAVICVPPDAVVGLIQQVAALGTRAAVVLSAGQTLAQKQAMLEAARPTLLRILGPNCLGLLVPHVGLNASFSHVDAQPGELAFVSQSGALVTAMLDWARGRGIGFSHFVSLGEHADVDFGDMLDYLASDARTRAILLYIESIEAPRKFMSAARAAARNKPVLVVKAGRSARGQQAAASHTGALAGSDLVYDAAIQRAGMLRVDTLDELFIAAETLARLRELPSERLTVLTNGGGAGVMAADAAERLGVPLAELSADTLARLSAVLPPNWSHGNPVDIIGDAPAQRYVDALEVLAQDAGTGAILFIHAPTAIVPSAQIAQALLPAASLHARRLLSCWLGDGAVAEARSQFRQAGLAGFATPEDAVQAFALLQRYRRNQTQLMETPAARDPHLAPAEPDLQAVRTLVRQALQEGRELLSEPEAKAVLEAYRIPVVATRRVAPEPAAAVAAAEAMGYPVVLKILSQDLSHKSDVGGVVLNLDTAAAVEVAASTLLERLRRLRPQARLEGFTVQAMVRQAHARELIVGASVDRVFGPVLLFGSGGTSVERVADRALALPPLNQPLAQALVARTRIARLLEAYRDVPAADVAAVHRVLIAVSQLLADVPEIAELDINPLLAYPERCHRTGCPRAGQCPGAVGLGTLSRSHPYPRPPREHSPLAGRRAHVAPHPPGRRSPAPGLPGPGGPGGRAPSGLPHAAQHRAQRAGPADADRLRPRDGAAGRGARARWRGRDPGRGARAQRPGPRRGRIRHPGALRPQGPGPGRPADAHPDRHPPCPGRAAPGGHGAQGEHRHDRPDAQAGFPDRRTGRGSSGLQCGLEPGAVAPTCGNRLKPAGP